MELFPLKRALQVFGRTPDDLEVMGISDSSLPDFARSPSDNRLLKSWSLRELPSVGARIGFLPKPREPKAISIFVTKGGVLKSTLTLNIARTAALHGIKTCVVGLDMQGDITTALAGENAADDHASFSEAIRRMDELRGLADLESRQSTLEEVILPTDIPTLFYIPETPELVSLDQNLIHRNRREFWLAENVIAPLKKKFDLILMDCSPNWNRLITNALVASDALISPLECKINNFRNFKTFQALISEFKTDMRAGFRQVYVPTRLTQSRKLSREIFEWYQAQLPDCASVAIRESTQGEEATAMRSSIIEYAPTSSAADEFRELMCEIWPALTADSRITLSKVTARRASELSI